MYNFAIIGCGAAAQKHAEQVQKIGKLTAVCDIDRSQADEFARQFSSKAYYSFEELLNAEKDVDVICLCTPNGYHAEHSIKSLQAGRNVVCESPFCLTKAGAWQTIETEKFCRRKLFVVSEAAFNPALDEVMTMLGGQSATCCTFHMAAVSRNIPGASDWRGQVFPGGGALYTHFHAAIQVLVRLFGPIAQANGFAKKDGGDESTETAGAVSLKMENGSIGTLHWTFSEGVVESNQLTIFSGDNRIQVKGEHFDQLQLGPVSTRPPSEERVLNPIAVFYSRINEALQGKHTGLPDIHAATRIVESIEKIYQAILPNPDLH